MDRQGASAAMPVIHQELAAKELLVTVGSTDVERQAKCLFVFDRFPVRRFAERFAVERQLSNDQEAL